MQPCYVLKTDASTDTQSEKDYSFIGGLPRIPEKTALPTCRLCGSELTFFFQVAFPNDHAWANLSMALFACTSCVHEEYFIPKMLDGPLPGINIPENFLTDYQKNFRVLVFKTEEGRLRHDYTEKVAFKRWQLVSSNRDSARETKIGGMPGWLLEDEAPATYNQTTPMVFLMQIQEDFPFDKLPDAPPQIMLGLTQEPEPSDDPYYELFLGNNVYFFGTKDSDDPLVYILTQI